MPTVKHSPCRLPKGLYDPIIKGLPATPGVVGLYVTFLRLDRTPCLRRKNTELNTVFPMQPIQCMSLVIAGQPFLYNWSMPNTWRTALWHPCIRFVWALNQEGRQAPESLGTLLMVLILRMLSNVPGECGAPPQSYPGDPASNDPSGLRVLIPPRLCERCCSPLPRQSIHPSGLQGS